MVSMNNTNNTKTNTCRRCGNVATLTMAGWRHGDPSLGHDGHCPGTGLWPDVDTPAHVEAGTSTQVTGRRVYRVLVGTRLVATYGTQASAHEHAAELAPGFVPEFL